MHISLVVSTWNNCERLAVTLAAISRCIVPRDVNWELILIANNCTDNTPAVCAEFGDRLPLVYLEEPNQGVSLARNTGVRASSGELVIFADDDMEPCPAWIAAYWSAYREMPTGFYFGGPVVSDYEAPPDPALLRLTRLESIVGLDFGPKSKPLDRDRGFASNWACPSDVLGRVGGFNPDLGLNPALGRQRAGEEIDLMERIRRESGLVGWYLPEARVLHHVPRRKYTMQHLAARIEAMGAYSVHAAAPRTPLPASSLRPDLGSWCERRGPLIAGVPWRLYGTTFARAAGWALA
ncbi:MAG: glycosyltransferase family 2 protein, partial [bacterium]|nr:glycosyltransferase family 2 protein [bacterium]